jgi:hypothetical protein
MVCGVGQIYILVAWPPPANCGKIRTKENGHDDGKKKMEEKKWSGVERASERTAYPTALARPRRFVFVRHAVETIWRAAIGPVPGPI